MFNYYIQVNSEEHMLYANEIARLYKINTIEGKPHKNFVSKYLEWYADNYISDYYQLYYQTRYGLTKVYPQSLYQPAMKLLIDTQKDKISIVTLNVYDKSYKVKFS